MFKRYFSNTILPLILTAFVVVGTALAIIYDSADCDPEAAVAYLEHEDRTSHGTGTLISPSVIMTAAHVATINNLPVTLKVTFPDGTERTGKAQVYGDVANIDVAFVILDEPVDIKPLDVSCEPLKLNQSYRTIGHPAYGKWIHNDVKVASLRNYAPEEGLIKQQVTISGAVAGGMSGSSLLNDDNEIVGVISTQYFQQVAAGFFGVTTMSMDLGGVAPMSVLCEATGRT